MKILKILLMAFLVVMIVGVVAFYMLLNSFIKKGIETLGPKVTQTSITLDKVKISPFSGSGEIRGLVIGNPEGYKTPSAFELEQVRIDLQLKSLFSNKIIINEILIKAPQVTYEAAGLTGSNIKQIKENIESISKKLPGTKPKEKESDSQPTPSKSVEISRFLFEDGNVQLSAKILQGNVIDIPLPAVNLSDIGKDGEIITFAESMRIIFGAISDAVLQAVIKSGKLNEIIGNTSKNIEESVKKSSSKVVDGLKKLFDKDKE